MQTPIQPPLKVGDELAEKLAQVKENLQIATDAYINAQKELLSTTLFEATGLSVGDVVKLVPHNIEIDTRAVPSKKICFFVDDKIVARFTLLSIQDDGSVLPNHRGGFTSQDWYKTCKIIKV
jgi:hypothetical protein